MWFKYLKSFNSIIIFCLTLRIMQISGSIIVQSQFDDNNIASIGHEKRTTTIEMAKYLQPYRAMASRLFSYPIIINTTPLSSRTSSISHNNVENEAKIKPIMSNLVGLKESLAMASHYDYVGGEDFNALNQPNYANQQPINIKTTPATTKSYKNMNENRKSEQIKPKPNTIMTDVSIYTLSRVYKHITGFVSNFLSANSNATTPKTNFMFNLAVICFHVLVEQTPKYLNDFAEQIRNFYKNCPSDILSNKDSSNTDDRSKFQKQAITRRTYGAFSLLESLTNTFEVAENTMALAFDEGRHKSKKKHLKRLMLPLLLAYKLKFLTMIPLLVAGLTLLVGTSGMAGFFFALFTAVMTLRLGGGGANSVVVKDL